MPQIKRTQEQIQEDIKNQSKVCCVCETRKPFSEYFNYKNKNDGKSYRCKTCDTDARKGWSERNPERAHTSMRNRNLKARFGVDIAWYEETLKAQGGCCNLCGATENCITGARPHLSFSVDHCHKTGTLRGLLCNRCNRCLGLWNEDTELLLKAVAYLEQARPKDEPLD